MRRFLAYIVMMVTLVFALIFNTQAVLDQKTDAMEYGSGTEMVFSLAERSDENYDEACTGIHEKKPEALSNIDIEKAVMDRLDLAGVRNANVRIVKGETENDTTKGYQLKISLSPLNEKELGRVKQVISVTGEFAVATIGDDTIMYQNAGKFFDTSDDLCEIVYNGTIPYPAINIVKEDYDELVEKAKEASEAHKNDVKSARRYNEGEEEAEEEDNSSTVYLWTNKTINDTYNKAFGVNETLVDDDVKAKVVATLNLNNYDSEAQKLTITSQEDGSSWDISSARAFVNMMNAKDYGFDIQFLYQNSVPASFGKNERGTYITYGVILGCLAVLVVFLILFYGIAGVSASLNLLASTLVSFLLFSLLGFEFSVAAVTGLFVLIVQSLLLSLNYFERVKGELKKGRDLEKANREGYHKSFFVSLDSSLVLLLSSLFCFLIALGSYKTFFGVIMVGSIFTFLITNYVNKWLMYWLCKDVHSDDKFHLFGKVNQKERKHYTFAHAAEHPTRKLSWILPSVIAVALAIALPTSYVLSKDDSFFNSQADFASGYVLNIQFNGQTQQYDTLSTKENFISYLEKIGTDAENVNNNEGYVMVPQGTKAEGNQVSFTYDPDTAFVNIVEKKDEDGNAYFIHYFSVDVSAKLDELNTANGKPVLQVIYDTMKGRGIALDETTEAAPVTGYSHYILDTLESGSYVTEPTNIAHNYSSMILLAFLLSVFASIYLIARHGLNIALSNLAGGTVLAGAGLALMVLTRVPFTSFTGFGLLAGILLFNVLSVLALSGNKETLKELGIKRTATIEQREEIANDVANRSLPIVFLSSIVTIFLSIGIAFIDLSLLGLSLTLILMVIVGFVGIYFYEIPLYHNLASHVFFAKAHERAEQRRIKRGKKKEEKVVSKDGIVYVDPEGPHETIIPGLNDFRTFK